MPTGVIISALPASPTLVGNELVPIVTVGVITAITQAASAVVTINTVSASNPFSATQQVYFSGVAGMTQINTLSAAISSVGGSSGAWTLTVPINSTAFSAYTSGGNATTTVAATSDEMIALVNQSYIGSQLYPRSAAEITAGITPVNLSYPPMNVDRYLINTGSNNMAPAFSAAWNVAQVAGGRVRAGATAPYNTTSPINFSNPNTGVQYGIHFVMETGLGISSFGAPSIIASHAGHVIDLTGTIGAILENVCIGTGSTSPLTAFFQSRTSNNSSVGITRFLHCGFVGTCTADAYYNYGAEDDALEDCYWHMAGSNSNACIAYTGNNIRSLISTFQTVATGSQSCIDHKIFGGEIYNGSSSATADCIRIETSNGMKAYAPWMYCAGAASNGRSLFYVDLTNGSSNFCLLDGIEGEQATYIQNYGVFFSNAPTTANQYIPVGWSIKGCLLSNGIAALATGGTNTTLNTMTISSINNSSAGNAVVIPGVLSDSTLDLNISSTLTIGTSTRNRLTGDTSKFTITTRNTDYWIDIGVTNKTIATVTTSAGITSSAGGLVARARLSLSGPCLTFNILLASGSGNISISANSTITLTAPGGQSLSLADSGACEVIDYTAGTSNGASVAASGSNALITIPVAVSATAHTIIVSGTVFLA